MDAGAVRPESHRSGCLWADFHGDAVVGQRKAVGQVLHIVNIGDDDGDFVAFLDGKLFEAEIRCFRIHVNAHLVAVADHRFGFFEVDAVLLGHGHGIGEGRIVAVVDVQWIHQGSVNDDAVMRFGEGRAVMHDLHFIARNVDELLVLRLQRTDIDEPVLRELVQRHQPLAVGILGLAHGCVIVAGLVLNVDLLDDRIDLLALERPDRFIDVPLGHLAVEEQGRERVALSVEGRVKRAKAQFRLGDDASARLDLVGEDIRQFGDIDYRNRRRQLAVDDDVAAVRRRVAAVRAVGNRDIAGVLRPLVAVDDRRIAFECLEVAVLDRLFDGLDVENHGPVLFAGGHFRQRHPLFTVVAGGNRIISLVIGVAVIQVAVDHHLPGDLHGIAVDGAENRFVLFGLVQDAAVVGHRNAVFAVSEDIPRARIFLRPQTVNVGRVRDLDDLIRLHDVAANAGDAGIGLVVDKQVTPVVGTFGEGHVGVVGVAVEINSAAAFQKLFGGGQQTLGQDLAAFVGIAPSGGAAPVEHRDAHQFAHGRNAQNANLASLPAAPEAVVFVQIARLYHRIVRGRLCGARCHYTLGQTGGPQTGNGSQFSSRTEKFPA